MSASMSLEQLNQLSEAGAKEAFRQCCAASDWVDAMASNRPYSNLDSVIAQADASWATMDETNIMEAFTAHPQIGNVDTLRAKFANTKALASGEQSSVSSADEATLQALAKGNQDYLKKFGFIFIVCATGKSAAEMLALLQARLVHDRAEELINGAEQQRQITAIRLRKMLEEE